MEMQMLSNLLTTICADAPMGPRALTISGEMGIGKTFLLAKICAMARERHVRVLEIRAYEYSQPFPYFPFIELLRKLFRRSSTDQLRFYTGLSHTHETFSSPEQISPLGIPLITSLARLFPELPALLHVQPFAEILPADQEKFRLFDALATIFERLATQEPLLLCIDNLQWMDSTSLELLLYLIIRLRTSQVALLGATRPPQSRPEQDDPAAQRATRALMELMQQGMWFPLPLGPLSREEMGEHIHTLLPGPQSAQVVEYLLNCAEGNPFFLEELVRTLSLNTHLFQHKGTWMLKPSASLSLPASILSLVDQRLQHVSPACLEILAIASLFGRTFPRDALLLTIEMEQGKKEREVQMLLDEAMQASLIAPGAEQEREPSPDRSEIAFSVTRSHYQFCRGIFYEVLQHRLPAPRVRALHQNIGQALEHYYAHEALRHAAELAAHYAASNDRVATLRWSLQAGEEAAHQQAHQLAIRHFRLVLQLCAEGVTLPPLSEIIIPSRAELSFMIGELWFRLGELKSAAEAFQQALEQPAQLVSLLRARLHRALADIYRMQARYDQALSHLQAASALLAETATDTITIEQHLPWPFQRATSTATVLTPACLSDVEHILLLQAQATLDILLNHPAQAEEGLWKAHQLATTLGDRSSQAFSLHLLGWVYGWGERIHDAIRLQQQAHELYIAIGDPFRAALGAQGLGIVHQALGEMDAANLHTERGFALARQYGVRQVLGWLYWNQGMQALMQGDWENCAARLQQALHEAQADENTRLMPVVRQAQAMLSWKRGLWPEAERYFEDALQAARNTDWFPSSVALYGHFLAVTGRRAAARIQLERAQALPEPSGFSGSFFIPFLAEGYLHLDTVEMATPYFARLSKLEGFLYYGLSVDRVLGELAVSARDWEAAKRSFAHGLQICRRANNQPETAAILYEQARMAIIQEAATAHIRALCEQAKSLFLQYDMQRAAALVDTLLDGIQDLEPEAQAISPSRKLATSYTSDFMFHTKLTKREREVLQLVAEGHTDREVADVLVLSHRTVHRHLSNIFIKLDVPGRASAVAYAIRHGLV
jgi:DNA-binding NarL/FixJ family response regulator/tetratricopeptide (TPR) repeat protein